MNFKAKQTPGILCLQETQLKHGCGELLCSCKQEAILKCSIKKKPPRTAHCYRVKMQNLTIPLPLEAAQSLAPLTLLRSIGRDKRNNHLSRSVLSLSWGQLKVFLLELRL